MAEAFVSYRRDDQAEVQRLVHGLRGQGLSVWWDQDIPPDAPWELTIEHELEAARVVIVAWSPAAVASENVKAEARRARQQGKLVQTYIVACDPPLFFGERQGVSLIGWKGDPTDRRFQTLAAAAAAVIAGKTPPDGVGYAPRRRSTWRIAGPGALLAATVLGLLANVGGVRDRLCRLADAKAACVQMGFAAPKTPVDAAAAAAEARNRLIQSLSGAWDRQDRSCAEPIFINAAIAGDGAARITVTDAKGFASTGQVIAADSGVVVSRNTTPTAAGAREQWEYRPNGDAMTVLDKDGVSTTLVRCPAPRG